MDILVYMSTQQRHVRVDLELYKQLKEVKQDIGIPITESIRRAAWFYLLQQGLVTESDVPDEIVASWKKVVS